MTLPRVQCVALITDDDDFFFLYCFSTLLRVQTFPFQTLKYFRIHRIVCIISILRDEEMEKRNCLSSRLYSTKK